MSGDTCDLLHNLLNRPQRTILHMKIFHSCSSRSSSPPDISSCSQVSEHPRFILPDDAFRDAALTGQTKEKLAGRVLTDLPRFAPPSESDSGCSDDDDEFFDDQTMTYDGSAHESQSKDDDRTVKALTSQRV